VATRLPGASQDAAADGVVDRLDAGAAAGTLKIYTGAQPADADDAATGTLLVTLTFSDPAFGASSGGTATAGVITSGTAVATGTAGWFRCADSDGVTVFDGDITAGGGGGDIELSSMSITTGDTVGVSSLTYTPPASE
jgi:hypothetical protein